MKGGSDVTRGMFASVTGNTELQGWKGLGGGVVWILLFLSFYRWLSAGSVPSHSAGESPGFLNLCLARVNQNLAAEFR